MHMAHDCPLAKLVRSYDVPPTPEDPALVWAAYDRLCELLPPDEDIQEAADEFGAALHARLRELHDALRACDGLPPLGHAL